MARYLRRNQDPSIDAAAVSRWASLIRLVFAIMSLCADIMFAPQAIASAAGALQVVPGLLTHASPRRGSVPGVPRTSQHACGFLIASGAMALALIGAVSWSFDRIIRDRRTYDWSGRP